MLYETDLHKNRFSLLQSSLQFWKDLTLRYFSSLSSLMQAYVIDDQYFGFGSIKNGYEQLEKVAKKLKTNSISYFFSYWNEWNKGNKNLKRL